MASAAPPEPRWQPRPRAAAAVRAVDVLVPLAASTAAVTVLAGEMGLSRADRDRLVWAALVHDVGRMVVPSEC